MKRHKLKIWGPIHLEAYFEKSWYKSLPKRPLLGEEKFSSRSSNF